MPSHGNTGWLAGGAVVPGRALIDTLPLVWQMVLVAVSWQVGGRRRRSREPGGHHQTRHQRCGL